MSKILVNFFHPALSDSRGNKVLADAVKNLPNVTFRHLDSEYKCEKGKCVLFDVAKEQQLLEKHQTIIIQHPVMWYNMPPLAKAWYDQVFQYGWAYPVEQSKLTGKTLQLAVTTGGLSEAYCSGGHYGFTVSETLRPQQMTAALCGMKFAPIFVTYGVRPESTGGISDNTLEEQAKRYVELVKKYAKAQP